MRKNRKLEILAETADEMMEPYVYWAKFRAFPYDSLISMPSDDKTAAIPCVSSEQRILRHPTAPQLYRLSATTPELEWVRLIPRESDQKQIRKVAHFWGYTGFPSDICYPSGTFRDALNKSKATYHYMGSVTYLQCSDRDQDSMITIAFRGSRSARGLGDRTVNPDWITDVDCGADIKGMAASKPSKMVISSIFFFPESRRDEILIHEGFFKSYFSCRQGIIEALNEVGIHNIKEFKGKIKVIGHSLGAGLATLCAYDLRGRLLIPDNKIYRPVPEATPPRSLALSPTQRMSCITYSSPCVGNQPFADDYKRYVTSGVSIEPGLSGCERVYISPDPIVYGLILFSLTHVGVEVELSTLVEQKGLNHALYDDEKFSLSNAADAHEPETVRRYLYLVAGQPEKFISMMQYYVSEDKAKSFSPLRRLGRLGGYSIGNPIRSELRATTEFYTIISKECINLHKKINRYDVGSEPHSDEQAIEQKLLIKIKQSVDNTIVLANELKTKIESPKDHLQVLEKINSHLDAMVTQFKKWISLNQSAADLPGKRLTALMQEVVTVYEKLLSLTAQESNMINGIIDAESTGRWPGGQLYAMVHNNSFFISSKPESMKKLSELPMLEEMPAAAAAAPAAAAAAAAPAAAAPGLRR